MFKTLYSKLVLGYIFFGLLGFLIISFISSSMTYDMLVKERSETLYAEATMIAEAYSHDFVYQEDLEDVAGQLEMVDLFTGADIWIVDDSGHILLASGNKSLQGRLIDGFDPVRDGRSYTTGRFYGMFSEDMLSVSAPINYGYSTGGYVLIHYPMSSVLFYSSSFLNIVYLASLILFALSFIILVVFTFTVYIPLKQITRGASEYASGNFNHKINMNGKNDEIGYLADTLDFMSGELARQEEYQKQFIANVSHDFRSPLTSIKGYLEAMLDGTIPPELAQKYIGRVLFETERLNKLTEGMLTLSSLDGKNILKRTRFDINKTIKDICASNENICTKKEISFQLTFESETEMVYADQGKIQQVIYNLIDNAIKFSPQGSVIYISTAARQRKIFVSVRDTGCGIPKESIKKIWDRFYKTDSSRGRDRSGTGLGLSIVKEIIQAHGENIDVVSTEKVGSEFTFSLPQAEDPSVSQET